MKFPGLYTLYIEQYRNISVPDKGFFPMEVVKQHFPAADDAFLQLFTLPVNAFDRTRAKEKNTDYFLSRAYVLDEKGEYVAYLRLIDAPTEKGIVLPQFVIEIDNPMTVEKGLAFLRQNGVEIENGQSIPLAYYRAGGDLVDRYNKDKLLSDAVSKETLRDKYFALSILSTRDASDKKASPDMGIAQTTVFARDFRKCVSHLVQMDLAHFHYTAAIVDQKPMLHGVSIINPYDNTALLETSMQKGQNRGHKLKTQDVLVFSIKEETAIISTRRVPELLELEVEDNTASRRIGAFDKEKLLLTDSFTKMKASLTKDPELVEAKSLKRPRIEPEGGGAIKIK